MYLLYVPVFSGVRVSANTLRFILAVLCAARPGTVPDARSFAWTAIRGAAAVAVG
jgi:hypothetical protein